jgi:hypothetical protein
VTASTHEERDATNIVYMKLITLLGFHRAVRRNVSLVNDEFWNIGVREFGGSGEGSEGDDGQPLEDQHDSD